MIQRMVHWTSVLVVVVSTGCQTAESRKPDGCLTTENGKAETPFEYFSNSWAVIGLKDYPNGTRITPHGEMILADGVLCRPLVGPSQVMIRRDVVKTLRDDCLPMVRSSFVLDDVRYETETFACPLPWTMDRYDGRDADNFLNVIGITLTNTKTTPSEAAFGFEWILKRAAKFSRDIVSNHVIILRNGKPCEVWRIPPQYVRLRHASGHSRYDRSSVSLTLPAKASMHIMVCIPYRPITATTDATISTLTNLSYDELAGRTAAYWKKLLDNGSTFEVPEAKPQNLYKASLAYMFLGRDNGDLRGGEGFYDEFYIRDGAYEAIALAQAGYLYAARVSLEHFLQRQNADGQFISQPRQYDANGYAIWAFVEYARLSRDISWLRYTYPAIRRAAAWIDRMRHTEKDPNSPYYGILPAAIADGEFLWDGKHHIVGYDWQNLRGLQMAAVAARMLSEKQDATDYEKQFEDYRGCILKALEKSGRPYFPPSYEGEGTHWGNLESVFPTVLIDPQDPRLTATLQHVEYEHDANDCDQPGFIEGTIQWTTPTWGGIHPYMSQFVTNTHIVRGDYDEAVDGFYSYQLHTTATQGFPEGVFFRQRQGWSNTIPHLWGAAMDVITLRNMLIREQGNTLHLLSCVPSHWLEEGKKIVVKDAPMHWGRCDMEVLAVREAIRMKLELFINDKQPNVVLHLPPTIRIASASIDGKPTCEFDDHTLRLDAGASYSPCELVVKIKRDLNAKPVTFASKVAAFEADPAHVVKPIPHVVPPPGANDINRFPFFSTRDGNDSTQYICTAIDLSAVATTDPFVSPFNKSNVGALVMDGLPVGEQTICGVLFDIGTPTCNNGKSLVVLNGKEETASLPKEVTVRVGRQGRYLCILGNVGGYTADDVNGATVAEYVIRYADGTTQTTPLIFGRTLDEWTVPYVAMDAPLAIQAGIWHLNILTIALESKPVESITFRDLGTPTAPLLAAMTIVGAS